MDRLLTISAFKRFLFFFADILIICISLYLSFLVHFEFNLNIRYFGLIREIVLFFVVLKLLALAALRVYKITWRYVGLSDLVNIFLAVFIAELVLLVISLPNALLPELAIGGLSKRIFFVDGFVSVGLIATAILPYWVIASEAKQSRKHSIIHEIASALCASQ